MAWYDGLPFIGKARGGANGGPALPSGGVARSIPNADFAAQNNAALSDGMGPGTPPVPAPLDRSGLPRQYQYRPGFNLPSVPGEGRMHFGTLRALADIYDLLRKCIEVRKDEIARMAWDISPTATNVREKRQLSLQYKSQIDKARDFFYAPDRVLTWQDWIRSVLEDYFVVDAISVYKQRTRGGDLYALLQLDGTTIKPLLDLQGRPPTPPAPAYQQYLYGIARTDFEREILRQAGQDDSTDRDIASFSTDELLYKPKNRRPFTPYGFSIVEQFALHVNLALRWQMWSSAFFTDGNIPQALLTAPEGWTADQIAEYMELWDASIAGDPRAQRSLRLLPFGTAAMAGYGEGLNFAKEFVNYLIDLTCVATDVTRQELGLDPSNTEGLGGAGHGQAMEGVQHRRSLRPLCAWLSDTLFTPIIRRDFGLTDFKWVWPELERDQDPMVEAQTNQIRLQTGQIALDDLLMEEGEEPIGVGRLFVVGSTVYGEPDLKQISTQGTLAMQQQMAMQQAEHANGLEKDKAKHSASLERGSAAMQAALERKNMAHQATLPGAAAGAKKEADPDLLKGECCDCAKDELGRCIEPKCACDCPTCHQGTPPKGSSEVMPAAWPSEATQAANAKLADLHKWERKAIKALKAGRSPQVSFESDVLEPDTVMVVQRGLRKAVLADDVRAAFDAVEQAEQVEQAEA